MPPSSFVSRRAPPGCCMSETCARRCSTGYLPGGMAENSSCGWTIPTAPAASPSSRRPSSATSPGSVSPGTLKERQSDRLAHYDTARDALIAVGPALSLLRDAGGAGVQAPPPARPGPAAGLRPRRAQARRRGAPAARRRGPQAALALQARGERGALGRPGARGPACRRGEPERSGAGARRRLLPLQLHLGGRRHRLRHHARDPRRGPRHQHRRADPDVRGARRPRPGVRPPAAAGRCGRWRLEQAHRLAVDRRAARARHRAAGASPRCWRGSARPIRSSR